MDGQPAQNNAQMQCVNFHQKRASCAHTSPSDNNQRWSSVFTVYCLRRCFSVSLLFSLLNFQSVCSGVNHLALARAREPGSHTHGLYQTMGNRWRFSTLIAFYFSWKFKRNFPLASGCISYTYIFHFLLCIRFHSYGIWHTAGCKIGIYGHKIKQQVKFLHAKGHKEKKNQPKPTYFNRWK